MVCGWPCGRVIKNSHTHNPFTLWKASVYNCLYQVTPARSTGERYKNKNTTQHSLQNCRNPNPNSLWYTAQPNLNLPQGSLTFFFGGPLLAVTTKSIPAFFSIFFILQRYYTCLVWWGWARWAVDVTILNNSPCHLGEPCSISRADTVCAVFSPVQTVVWLPMLWTFKVHTAV